MKEASLHAERARKLNLIWKHTHPDFKGTMNGSRTIMIFRKGQGTCLVYLSDLTLDEIDDKFTYAAKMEAKQKGKS